MTDAECFLIGENPHHNTGLFPSATSKFYAVKNGRIPGIYTDWPSAQEQITGWSKPRHKCFATRIEAQRFLQEDEKSGEVQEFNADDHGALTVDDSTNKFDESMLKPVVAKKPRRVINSNTKTTKTALAEYIESDYAAGTGPLPPGMEDGFDSNIFMDPQTGHVLYKSEEQRQATKIQMIGGSQTETLRIFTDGSALGNGGPQAFAGVGVYFGPGDQRYLSPRIFIESWDSELICVLGIFPKHFLVSAKQINARSLQRFCEPLTSFRGTAM